MDVTLAPERLFVLEEKLTVDEIQQRAMDKRTQAFGGGLGAFLQRPKTEEVVLVAKQRRLEPFWHVRGKATYEYERNRSYTVPAGSPDVEAVTINGTRYDGAPAPQRTFAVPVLEHCRATFTSESFTDGLTGASVSEGAALITGPRSEVGDPQALTANETLAEPPEHRASFVVRQVMSQIMKPVQADRVLEEAVELEVTDLYYRPWWAFEFTWQGKGKQGVVEIDAITGNTRQGKPLTGQIRSMFNRDVLFDVGADTVGLFVPGGSIAVKIAKAAIDSNKK